MTARRARPVSLIAPAPAPCVDQHQAHKLVSRVSIRLPVYLRALVRAVAAEDNVDEGRAVRELLELGLAARAANAEASSQLAAGDDVDVARIAAAAIAAVGARNVRHETRGRRRRSSGGSRA